MEKQEFFDKLHERLGAKYNVPARTIRTMRMIILGLGGTDESLIQWTSKYIKRRLPYVKDPNAKAKVIFMTEFKRFLEELDSSGWNDILQITKFDKQTKLVTV